MWECWLSMQQLEVTQCTSDLPHISFWLNFTTTRYRTHMVKPPYPQLFQENYTCYNFIWKTEEDRDLLTNGSLTKCPQLVSLSLPEVRSLKQFVSPAWVAVMHVLEPSSVPPGSWLARGWNWGWKPGLELRNSSRRCGYTNLHVNILGKQWVLTDTLMAKERDTQESI